MSVTILKTSPSTNTEAKNPRFRHGDAIVAFEQTEGRGQRGNRWSSRAGENLTFSLVWEPTFLDAPKQFLLSEAVALALCDTLEKYGIAVAIKWPNDIYAGDRKVCGILIEHFISEGRLSRTIVGIGLNVNQTSFEEWIPNPTSMKLLTEREEDIMAVFNTLYGDFDRRYRQLLEGGAERLQQEYRGRLYRLDEAHTYALPDGSRFEGILRGVEPDGGLIVEHGGTLDRYMFKEIEFVIN